MKTKRVKHKNDYAILFVSPDRVCSSGGGIMIIIIIMCSVWRVRILNVIIYKLAITPHILCTYL